MHIFMDYLSLHYVLPLVALILLVVTIVTAKVSFEIANSQRPKIETRGTGALEAALYALLGLIIAFSFAGAHSRFDERRQLIIKEANAISTAFLRLDLLPSSQRSEVQGTFIKYIDSRLAFYPKMVEVESAFEELKQTETIQSEIWNQVFAATEGSQSNTARMLLIPALNEMFDLVKTRTLTILTHTPSWIFLMMFMLVIFCAILSGISMAKIGKFSYTYTLAFAVVIAMAIYTILDLEYPRFGLIQLDFVQGVFAELKAFMVQHMES